MAEAVACTESREYISDFTPETFFKKKQKTLFSSDTAKHQKKYLFKNKETKPCSKGLSTGNIVRASQFEPPLSWDKQRKKKLADITIFQTLTTIFTALWAEA